MIFGSFQGERLSLLGFGAMRLPQTADKNIDEKLTAEMTRRAIEGGVNYFDTAYPYHAGQSERVMGRILRAYPRDSYNLASKYPGHQILDSYNPAEIFEEQLEKCGVEYFDYYLLHNVYENSIATYTDPKWGIIDYFKEQKRLGRIRHLGFSSHAAVDALKTFLDAHGVDMEFCQIQLNYLDWTLQDAKAKYELLTARGIPVWVMEPVRGGRLAKLSENEENTLKSLRPDESAAAWCFRFLQGLPNVKMILSGMSDMAQMEDNIRTFAGRAPLAEDEVRALFAIAEGMKDSVPCTGCRYCVDGCPMGLNIPALLATYNEIRFAPSTNTAMRLDALPADKLPSACVSCGNCKAICPQSIDIPRALAQFTKVLETIPRWADICLERAKAAKRKA